MTRWWLLAGLSLALAPACASRSPAPAAAPASHSCVEDADCILTPYERPVANGSECYCPGCPLVRPASEAAQNRRQWEGTCGAEWARAAGCAAPVCARPPGKPVCRAGRCELAVPPGEM